MRPPRIVWRWLAAAAALVCLLSQDRADISLATARGSPVVAELCGSTAGFSFGLQPGARAGSDASVMGEGAGCDDAAPLAVRDRACLGQRRRDGTVAGVKREHALRSPAVPSQVTCRGCAASAGAQTTPVRATPGSCPSCMRHSSPSGPGRLSSPQARPSRSRRRARRRAGTRGWADYRWR